MTSRRPPDFDLARSLGAPSFTPRASDLDALVVLLAGADDDLAETIERTLVRIPDAAEARAASYATAVPPLRGRLIRLLARLAAEPGPRRDRICSILAGASQDPDDKTARNAIIALGRLGGEGTEEALLLRLARPAPAALKRSLAESLGKVGGARAHAALAELHDPGDAELERIVERAQVRLERDQARSSGGAIDAERSPAQPTPILASCRAGLESFVVDELGGRMVRPGAVLATLDGSYASLFRARTFSHAGFPLDEGTDLAAILTSPAALAIFRRFTVGPIRYRLAFLQGGHRRAEVLAVAREVRAREHDLVNDPKSSPWEAEVRERGDRFIVTLFPRVEDPRFTYRRRDVPGASHPTIAAALVRAAGIVAGDVVWDPFVGSGTELVERARAGAFAALHGSGISMRMRSPSRRRTSPPPVSRPPCSPATHGHRRRRERR